MNLIDKKSTKIPITLNFIHFFPSSLLILSLITVTFSFLSACSSSTPNSTLAGAKVDHAAALPSSNKLLEQMEKVANWQIPRIDSLAYLDFKREESLEPARWVQGAFYIGLTEIAERSQNPFYTKWIAYKTNELNWQLGKIPYFGDDQLIAQTYIWYYLNHHKSDRFLEPTKSAFDKILNGNPTNSLEFSTQRNEDGLNVCQKRWCWADALFMAPASWFGLSIATGDERYANYAHKEVKATVNYLFDPEHDLLYRDSRFKTQTDDFGNQLFWSRGSGWVFAGLARMMEFIPQNDPNRSFYENLFKKMAAKLKELQKQDGSWSMSLLAKEKMPQPETSGTGFFTYGLAWGINNKLLSEDEYLPSVTRGWSALNAAVQPDGKLGWVQQIGAAPGKVNENDSQIYAVGAYLLAGSELYDFQKANSK